MKKACGPTRSSLESTGWADRARSIGAALLIGVWISQFAHGEEQHPFVRNEVRTIEARVESVDRSSGQLAVRTLSGERTVFSLGKDVKNLDRVRIGDRVVLYDSMEVAAEIKPAGEPMTQRSETTTSNGNPDLLPQGTVRRTVTMTVGFQSLDAKGRTITFRRPDGTSRTAKLGDDAALEFAKRLKTGDRVSITYTKSTAFKITSR